MPRFERVIPGLSTYEIPALPDRLGRLKARVRECACEVVSAAKEGAVSLVLELPQAPAAVPLWDGPQFHLLHGNRDDLHFGYGVAREWRASGADRLSVLRGSATGLSQSWRHLDPDETDFKGFALLGFAARPSAAGCPSSHGMPNALLWLPEIALRIRRGQAALVLSTGLPTTSDRLCRRWSSLLDRLVPTLSEPAPAPLRPAGLSRCMDTPNPEGWRHLLEQALSHIAAGDFQKVVVPRRLRIQGSRRFDLARLLATLTFFYPSCQIMSIRHGDASFVAATPERLLSLHGNRVEIDALAGTTSRAVETHRDGALAEALRCSPKNLREHRLVVQAIRDGLGRYASRIEAADSPAVMQLNNAQHLWTRIAATLDTPSDVFALAECLHPTPATNGQPRRSASNWLERSDPFERGWYTGAAGIVEPDLSGELWVLLRCAKIKDCTADLYAGAGIVAGSDPEMEWRETEHKLAAMLSALRLS